MVPITPTASAQICQFTTQGLTPTDPPICSSPASQEKLAVYEKRFKPTRPYERIADQLSRTTFENALHTSAAMRDNHFDSVILVTSWDHMLCSYFLLKAMTTWGSQTRVLVHAVPTGPLNQANWHQHRIGWMMVYNEMLKFWGSIIELAGYKINGTILEQVPGESGLAGRLKQVSVFRIDFGELQG